MTDDLVKRLRKRQEFEFIDGHKRVEWEDEDALEAADRIEELEKRVLQAKMVFATMRSEMSSVCAVMKAFENEQ